LSINSRLLLYIAAIIAASTSLRIIYTCISPLQLEIQQDLGASYSQFGLLAALPQLCAGAFSFALPLLLRRANAEQIGLAGLAMISILVLTPFVVTSLAWLYLFVIIIGIGIAVCQPVLNGVIKHHFHARSMQMVALMALCMHVGSSFAAITTHGFAEYFGDWRWSLFTFGVITLLFLLVWFIAFFNDIKRPQHTEKQIEKVDTSHLYFSKTTWLIVSYFTSSGIIYISLLAWLPNYFHSINGDGQYAAYMLGLFVANQAAAAFLLTLFSRNSWDKRRMLYLAGLLIFGSVIVAVIGDETIAPLFPVLAGLGLGISFPVALSLPHSYGENPYETATLSMFGLGLGSGFSAPFPFIIGWLKDHTSIPNVLVWVVLLSLALMFAVSYQFKPKQQH